jgi:peptidoglycan hydrolase-like protein with peptidoglycan-binding domain
MIFRLIIISFAYMLLFANSSFGHSGGLNAQGCHAGSKPYHCHRSSSEMVRSSSGGNRLKCSDGSRSKDCVKKPTPRPTPRYDYTTVRSKQYMLAIHCRSVGTSFVDGSWGPNSINVLKRFQKAYGLVPDGIIGPKTISAFKRPVSGRCR